MILVVDDEPGVCVAFGRVLYSARVTFQAVESVAEATAALNLGLWTGFILDIHLPDGTGVDLLEIIRLRPEHQHTPIAVITADILFDDGLAERIRAGRAALHCGAFDRTAIEAICAELLVKSGSHRTSGP